MRNKVKYIFGLFAVLFILSVQPAFAADPPAPSLFSNPMAVTMLVLMILLLIVIGILANILIGTADFKLKKKKNGGTVVSTVFVAIFLLSGNALFAQGTPDAGNSVAAAKTIGGMPASTFYIMATVLFLELFIIIALLINIKFLLKTEKDKLLSPQEMEEVKKTRLSWWDRFNKLKPVSQEAELDLGHEYDGIRELNNRLPPWWLYGFYLTIIFAGIYLWRFHVSHTGPTSAQEYERAVVSAKIRVDEYLKKKGEAVDETNVTMLTGADDLAAGKAIFTDPTKCPSCHLADGGGNTVGPNLTDNFWLYGGDIKDIFKTIKYGTNKGMRSWKDDLSPKQMAQVASYVKSLKGTKPANPREPQGTLYEDAPAKDTAQKASGDTAVVKK
jgi:cytochrome c oxidase cbb3-type subunit III